jgi:hypothetical protein
MVRSTTNPHFQHNEYSEWQNVHSELVAESIENFGIDMYYMPRRRSAAFDDIFYEDTQSTYDTAYQIPIYIKSSENFIGSEATMSDFGIELRLQLILSMAQIHFENNIGEYEADIYRPQEGDLIHIPAFDHRTYEIKFVDAHPDFFQHGHTPRYDLTVEMWEYGNEVLSTGIEAVDCLQAKSSINAYDWTILTEDGRSILTEHGDLITIEAFRSEGGQEATGVFDTNDEFQAEANTIIDWTEDNPWGEGQW